MSIKKPTTYWNTRVVYNPKTQQIGFKEVYYTKDKIKNWTIDFINPNKILKKYLKSALSKPILKENNKSLKPYV